MNFIKNVILYQECNNNWHDHFSFLLWYPCSIDDKFVVSKLGRSEHGEHGLFRSSLFGYKCL